MAANISKFGSALTAMSAPVLILLFVALVAQTSDSASVPVPIINSVPEDLKSLASSRILMDYTSSSPTAPLKFNPSSSKNQQVISNTEAHSQDTVSSAKTVPLPSPSVSPVVSSNSEQQEKKYSQDFLTTSSPLHVARCRANCIEKFNTQDANNNEATSTLLDSSVEEMHLLPILRVKRKKRSTLPSLTGRMKLNKFANKENRSPSWSCSRDSADCFTCWESCKLLEPGNKEEGEGEQEVDSFDSTYTTKLPQPQENGKGDDEHQTPSATSHLQQQEIKIEEEKKTENKSKQSIISCSQLLVDSSKCTVGCQVACSFYERLLTKNEKESHQYYQHHHQQQKQDEGATEQENAFTSRDPVVATKQESVVRIDPGKISWLREARTGNEEDALPSLGSGSGESDSPVVYVVIQEYPDRKWRQIAQTTETEIEIPMELTSTMKTKLRSVRVLVVGPEGLLSVYSPEKQERLADNNNDNISREKMVVAQNEITKTAATVKESDGEDGDEVSETEFITTRSDELIGDSFVQSIVTNVVTQSPSFEVKGENTASITTSIEDNLFEGEGIEEEPFELRRVSLIHQKSLVIAELQWNGIGNNPSQEYLITWELTGGGLKGHLVTDSTSVTLSLWPDTLYQIQVELFEQNFDGDGEQPAIESSTVSLKSLPLIVDTSEASFPLENPSALLGNNDEEEEDEEDESEQEGNEWEEEEEEDPEHKSITGFLNMTLVLGISVTALIFVLVILTLAAFTWRRTRSFSSSQVGCVSGKEGRYCYNGCFSDCTEPELLLSQDELLDDSSTTPVRFFSMGLSKSKQACGHSVLNSDVKIVPSDIYTISSNSPGEISHSTFSFWNEHSSHLHTVSQLSMADIKKCSSRPFHH